MILDGQCLSGFWGPHSIIVIQYGPAGNKIVGMWMEGLPPVRTDPRKTLNPKPSTPKPEFNPKP